MQEQLAALINTYPALQKHGAPSSYMLYSNDDKHITTQFLKVCHADMPFMMSGVFDQLITAMPFTDMISYDYIRFLSDGPFRLFADRIHVEEFNGSKYIRCSDLHTWPANVLYNFCIATRMPIEDHHMLEHWWSMWLGGVDPGLAMLVAARIAHCTDRVSWEFKPAPLHDADPWIRKIRQIEIMSPNSNHMWFNTTSDWRAIMSGNMVMKAFNGNYKDNPKQARPCDQIWGKVGRKEGSSLVGLTVKELTQHFSKDSKSHDEQVDLYKKMYPNPPFVQPLVEFEMEDDDDFDEDEIFDDFDDDAEF